MGVGAVLEASLTPFCILLIGLYGEEGHTGLLFSRTGALHIPSSLNNLISQVVLPPSDLPLLVPLPPGTDSTVRQAGPS